ncbi:class I adenylate-forming enzyme family protein [Streptomyces sp. cg36]|uniref:class I adenylate-forming enzyme family protein n=1 Tax=Streptomyces sp. cg36 TaxID=3238798 RepID=UPI0034E2FBB4
MTRPHLWSPWETAARQPGRLAVVADGESRTFAELVRAADALGHGLRGHGLAAGTVLSTDIPTGPRFFALALAALRHGYGLLPVDVAHYGAAVAPALLRDMAVALHVTDDAARSGTMALPCPTLLDTELAAAPPAHDPYGPAPAPHAGFLAFTTSGTTGRPQGVARPAPRRAYKGVAVAERYGAGIGLGPHLMANPAYHLGTLGPALYALQAGSAVVVQRTWSPDAFAALADQYGADSAFLSPDCLLELVAAGQAPERRLRTVFHGGDTCPPGIKHRAIELLGPVLHEYYGTSRGTLTEITTPEWLRHPGSVGRPLPGIRIEVRGDGRPVPTGESGEIHVRLRAADLAPGEDGMLATGDIGFLDEAGYLFVVGRAGREHPYAQPRFEYEIRRLAGVTDAAVVAGTGLECHVEAQADRDADALRADIEAAARHLHLPLARIHLAAPGTLPRTPSGKIRRAALVPAPTAPERG